MPQDWQITDTPTVKPPPQAPKSGWQITDASTKDTSANGLAAGLAPKPGVTIGPRENAPLTDWLEELKGDVMHGTTTTMPGRALHAMGATGLERGVSPTVAQTMGGELIGPAKVAHALSGDIQTPQKPGEGHFSPRNIRNFNELVSGIFQSPGPGGALIPGALPAISMYGPAGAAVNKGAQLLGANPEQAEAAQNAAMLGAPLIHTGINATAPAVGRFVRNKVAPVVGTVTGPVAGYGLAAINTLRTGNPANLLFASKQATSRGAAIGSGLTRAAGSGISAVGEVPQPLFDTSAITPTGEVQPTPQQETGKFARNVMGMRGAGTPPERPQLPSRAGALVTPPPGYSSYVEPQPPVASAQPQVVHGRGGRMVRQYTAEPTTGATQVNPGQGIIPSFASGPPQAPPPVHGPTAAQPTVNQEEKPLVDTGLESGGSQFTSGFPPKEPPTQSGAFNAPLVNTEGVVTRGEVLPPASRESENGYETPEESRLMAEYARRYELEHNPIEGDLIRGRFPRTESELPAPLTSESNKSIINTGGQVNLPTEQLPTRDIERRFKENLEQGKKGRNEPPWWEENREAQLITPPSTQEFRNPFRRNKSEEPAQIDQSRRNFLKQGAQTLAAKALPEGITNQLIKTVMGEEPSIKVSSLHELGGVIANHLYGAPKEFDEWINPDTSYNEKGEVSPVDVGQAIASMVGNHIDNLFDYGNDEPEVMEGAEALRSAIPAIRKAYQMMGLSEDNIPDIDGIVHDLQLNILKGRKNFLEDQENPGVHWKGKPQEQRPEIQEREKPSELIKTPKDLDEKAMQAEFRNKLEQGHPQFSGETPWEHEPPEGASASHAIAPEQEHYFNPHTGKNEPDLGSAGELNDLYAKDVIEGMEKTHGELIDTRGVEKPPARRPQDLDRHDRHVEEASQWLADNGYGKPSHPQSVEGGEDIIDTARKEGWVPEEEKEQPQQWIDLPTHMRKQVEDASNWLMDEHNIPESDLTDLLNENPLSIIDRARDLGWNPPSNLINPSGLSSPNRELMGGGQNLHPFDRLTADQRAKGKEEFIRTFLMGHPDLSESYIDGLGTIAQARLAERLGLDINSKQSKDAMHYFATEGKEPPEETPKGPKGDQWEVFDPRDGKPIASYDTQEEAKQHAESSPNLDYGLTLGKQPEDSGISEIDKGKLIDEASKWLIDNGHFTEEEINRMHSMNNIDRVIDLAESMGWKPDGEDEGGQLVKPPEEPKKPNGGGEPGQGSNLTPEESSRLTSASDYLELRGYNRWQIENMRPDQLFETAKHHGWDPNKVSKDPTDDAWSFLRTIPGETAKLTTASDKEVLDRARELGWVPPEEMPNALIKPPRTAEQSREAIRQDLIDTKGIQIAMRELAEKPPQKGEYKEPSASHKIGPYTTQKKISTPQFDQVAANRWVPAEHQQEAIRNFKEGTVFHGTKLRFLDSILKEGLKPGPEHLSGAAYSKMAEGYAQDGPETYEGDDDLTQEPGVILKLKVDPNKVIKEAKKIYGHLDLSDLPLGKSVPPTSIDMEGSEIWFPDGHTENLAEFLAKKKE